ncbi:ATP synthase subunit I [Marinobacter arenosus]|uniref:ATP synthase subunit I n=1 Tax=Marinobacter arenosus TaxID=2856822 RepID=UPI001C4BDCC3|nr:ATP synthase subunit I [Marinobacter arenosus]MBW0148387.1 ATP synthase subunit I [Marinobacter arenosus]
MTADWGATLIGFGVGVATSVLFFAGLMLGIRMALQIGRPATVLLPSAALRIAILLGAGWVITGQGTDGWALAGYVAGFFLVRFVAIRMARVPGGREV